MKAIQTTLKDCFIIEPAVFEDSRGYFFESFNQAKFESLTGQNGLFIQDNQSSSTYGVLRGLHSQKGNTSQAKLVRALEGMIWDVAVDIRPDSPTYLQWFGVELSAENKRQLYVPRGFLHGFSVLSPKAQVAYKVDNIYDKEAEFGIKFDDPTFQIDWKLPADAVILSEKDAVLEYFTV